MKRVKKKIRRLAVTLIIIFFFISLFVSMAFAVIIYSEQKNELIKAAESNYNQVKADLMQDGVSNDDVYYNNTDPKVRILLNVKDGETIFDTGTAFGANFVDDEGDMSFGRVDIEHFINSIPSEKLKMIEDSLSRPLSGNNYYELVCDEYFEATNNSLVPTKVSLVETAESHTWNVQDEVIESFLLDIDTANRKIHRSGLMHRNVIPTDIFFRSPILKSVNKEFSDKLTNCGHFDYIFSKTERVYPVTPVVGMEFDGEKGTYVYVEERFHEYEMTYFEIFNVLDHGESVIVMSSAYTFILFFIVGSIVILISTRTLKKELKQEEELREYTNILAHNLKTPLFVISGNAELLRESFVNGAAQRYAETICKKSNEMNELIHRTITLSKLDSIGFEPQLEMIDVTELITNITRQYRDDIKPEIKESCVIKADKELLTLALENLIENAVAYTNDICSVKISVNQNEIIVENSFDDLDKKASQILKNGVGLSIVKKVCRIQGFVLGIKKMNGIFSAAIELNN